MSCSKQYFSFCTLKCIFVAINNGSDIFKIPHEERVYYVFLIHVCIIMNQFPCTEMCFVFGFLLYCLSKSLLYCWNNYLIIGSFAIQVTFLQNAAFLHCLVYVFNRLLIVKFWQELNKYEKQISCFYNVLSLPSYSKYNVSSWQESAIDICGMNLLIIANVFTFTATEERQNDNSPIYFLF